MQEIQLFKHEIQDGIADSIKSQASIAYCSQANLIASPFRVTENTPEEELLKLGISKAENKNQFDLYYLESVLVSTGWNKNDDVFLADATWEARNTPEDKQFNFMHNENDIIGHITGSYVLDKDGKRIPSEQQDAPEDFDIITQAVLYNSWTNPENRDRMQQIIAEIEEGKWYVSMECLFAGFDYAVIDKAGAMKVIARNDESSFLSKHLRSYGGTGEYEGYKIGRSLRQISFSGKGLVSKPANPRSIILRPQALASFKSNDKIVNFSIGENDMSETSLEKQLADLTAELALAKEENVALKAQVESTVAENTQTVAEMEETIKSTQAKIAELEDALAKSNEQLTAAMKNMQEMQKKEKMQKRMATLIEAGFDQEEATEALSSFEGLADEAFDTVVAAVKKKMGKMGEPAAEDAKKGMAEEVPATPEVFENLQTTEAALVEAVVEDELHVARASISSWLENNVLTKKK